MTNVAIQTAVEMENLRIDLEQQNTILETKAIRELGLGVITPALVNLIIEIYTNKAVLVAMNRLKNGIQRNTSLLIGLMEDPKRSLNNPVIVTVRKKLVEKNSKLTKLKEFYSLDDDKIDENMKDKIENLLKSGAEN